MLKRKIHEVEFLTLLSGCIQAVEFLKNFWYNINNERRNGINRNLEGLGLDSSLRNRWKNPSRRSGVRRYNSTSLRMEFRT